MINHFFKAVIRRSDGRFLFQKGDSLTNSSFSGCWDFFGGLVGDKKSILDALTRELEEKLDITIANHSTKELFTWVCKESWHTTINHYFYIDVKLYMETIRLREDAGIDWFFLHEIVSFPLTPAVYENYHSLVKLTGLQSDDFLAKVDQELTATFGIIKKNERVYYAKVNPFGLSMQTILLYKSLAILKSQPVMRICLHTNDQSDVHEMLMIHSIPNKSVGPLKQMKTSLSYHIIQGTLSVFLYDESGEDITERHIISNDGFREGAVSFIRLNAAQFRSVKNISQTAVFLEVASGPFKDDDTIWLSKTHVKNGKHDY